MRGSSDFKVLFDELSPSDEKGEFFPLFEKRVEEPKLGHAEIEERNLEEELRKAFEEAYIQGEKAGFELGMKKAEVLVARLNTYIRQIEEFKKELLERVEKVSFELAFVLAEAIVLKECDVDRGCVLRMVKKGMELLNEKSKVVIRVRKDDAAYIKENLPDLEVIPDEKMVEPGFLIESEFGIIDGTLSTQLSELRKMLLG